MFHVSFFLVLLCAFTEHCLIYNPRGISRLTLKNAEKFQVDYREIFNFFSAIPPFGQQEGSIENIRKGPNVAESATNIKPASQQTATLNATQIAEIEQRTKNNPNELQTELKFRLTPDIFGPICLNKTTPEALNDWLISERPRINLWTNEKVVRALQAEMQSEMRSSGLIVDRTKGYLAALPDGLIGDRAVLKVHVAQLLRKDLDSDENFLDNQLSQEKYLYYEIQGLLAITDRPECILVTVSTEFIKSVVIKRNWDFWDSKMVKKIEQIYTKTLLYEPSSDQQLSVRELNEDTLRDRVKELLTCSVCTEVIQPPYKVCRNGHLLCHECFPQLLKTARENGELPKCPTCREPIPPKPSRCLPYEILCNFIDPKISPIPVIKKDDPMDTSSSNLLPEFSEIQWDYGRAITPVAFNRLIYPKKRRRVLASDTRRRGSSERRRIQPSPRLARERGLPDIQNPSDLHFSPQSSLPLFRSLPLPLPPPPSSPPSPLPFSGGPVPQIQR